MQKIKKKTYSTKKQPEEEIKSIAHKAAEVLSRYKKQAVVAASIVVTAAVIVVSYMITQSVRDKKASALLPAAYEYYRPGSGVPPDYKKALDLYRDISNKYSGTASGAIARYYAANCLVNLGRVNEALAEYRNFVKKYSGEKFLLGLVYQRMGYVYSALGNHTEAVKAFERSEALTGPGLATMELAKLYERAGNTAEAEKKYKLITEKLGGSMWAMEALTKIQQPGLSMPGQGKEKK